MIHTIKGVRVVSEAEVDVFLELPVFVCDLVNVGTLISGSSFFGFLLQFSSVTKSCLTLYDPMNHSTPGLPVHHQLPEFTQTHVHRVGDAIQPSHLLLSPSPPAPNPSQHQGLLQWVNSSHEVAEVLEFQLQHQSFMNTQDWSPLGWTGWISLQSKGLSRVFNTTVQKHQFFSAQLSSQSDSHIHTWPLEKQYPSLHRPLLAK